MTTTDETVRSALSHIPNHDRRVWIKVGFAVKDALGEEGFHAWNEWSRGAASYREKDARTAWRSFRLRRGGITAATLWFLAKQHGWVPSESPSTLPRSAPRPSRAQLEAEERRERERRQRAALWANELIRAATFGEHVYLIRKGFPDERGLVVPGECVNEVLGWDWLHDSEVEYFLVPVRSGGNAVQSVQLIAPDGEKRFLPGGQIKGGRFEISSHRFSPLRWYVEGYATGLSVREALRELRWIDGVVVCFSDHNVQTLATADARALVVADHDLWKCPSCAKRWSGEWPQHRCPGCGETSALGKPAGERAARESGRPFWIPPTGDANDYHLSRGMEDLVQVVRKLRAEVMT